MTTGVVATTSTLTVNGGTLHGKSYALNIYKNSACTANLNGGYFYSDKESADIYVQTNAHLNAMGGYFKSEITPASGYNCVAETVTEGGLTYNYKIVESSVDLIEVDGTKYTSLVPALETINAATTDVNVKMLENVELSDNFLITNETAKVTLDLNGKEISSDTYYVGTNAAGADLTIKDDAGDGAIKCTSIASAKFGVEAISGKLTIESGKFIGPRAVYCTTGGTMIINGGAFTGTAPADTTTYGAYCYAGTMTVNGGTFTGSYGAYVRYGATMNITGGDFNGTTDGIYVVSQKDNKTSLNISGTPNIYGATRGVYVYNSTYEYAAPSFTMTGGTVKGGTTALNCTGKSDCTITGGTIIAGTKYGIYFQNNVTATIGGNAYVYAPDNSALYSYTSVAERVNTVTIEGNAILRNEGGTNKVIIANRSTSGKGTSSITINGGWFSTGKAAGTDATEDTSSSTLFTTAVASWIKISGGHFDRHARASFVTNGGGTQTVLDTPVNDPLESCVGGPDGEKTTKVSYTNLVSK